VAPHPSQSDDRDRDSPITPFSQLEAPGASSTGLTAEERRAIFIDQEALRDNADVQKNIREFTILDPFAGSGTTLVEASVLGIHALGIELSPFNCLIVQAKIRRHELPTLRREVNDALKKAEEFSRELWHRDPQPLRPRFQTESEYLRTWLAPRSLQQILFYNSIIDDYECKDVLRIILSRAARSARLIPHYDLARPKEPLKPGEEYYCAKHKRMCRPIEDALKFFRRYSRDTLSRIEEFEGLRTKARVRILEGDARSTPLPHGRRFDGVFTSPPYVGLIDYHEQHRYAYELFPELERRDDEEIGPTALGKSRKAQRAYQADIAAAFRHLRRWLKPDARVFVVANDRHDLYPAIGDAAGLRLVDTFHRPVPMRTERDTATYFESIFWFEPAG